MKLWSIFALLCVVATVTQAAVVELTADNFDTIIDGSKPALVKFYAPWCGHCKRMAPDYEELAEQYARHSRKVIVAHVDCDQHKDTCQRYGVSGYPTLKYFTGDSHSTPQAYQGGRTLEDLSQFIQKETGLRPASGGAISHVRVLDDSDFDSVVFAPDTYAFVEFYAPWCGHCKSLAPKWEKLAEAFRAESQVVIANVNADDKKDLASKYGVTGFPTLIFFSPSHPEGQRYSGARELDALVEHVNEVAGTQRTASGMLNGDAGRVAQLDELVREFVAAEKDKAAEVLERFEAKVAQLTDAAQQWSAKVYARALAKYHSAADYVQQETARLQKMIDSGSVSSQKIDEFKKRINILDSF
eukprot:CAMPEP_0177650714 /NCGR_PEP_ID=MMETSP0447-20121125/12102_1 /TAXON_ID=0 /ORGANISM="Stygamoeba regulata, Strain BSH-02190019" /LENGTH=356 /DNA_ID=CAMNT_0019153627 /DNA_START=69 /DNA_END=1139 /DNA_ORIENTATION=-